MKSLPLFGGICIGLRGYRVKVRRRGVGTRRPILRSRMSSITTFVGRQERSRVGSRTAVKVNSVVNGHELHLTPPLSRFDYARSALKLST